MTASWSRRRFVDAAARIGVLAPLAGVSACAPQGGSGDGEAADPQRPILLPWGDSDVRIDAPLQELPMAYVSMARREVFVDFAFRDRSNWILDAHISVSTGVWRIPLPGDPDRMYITPGDTLREFDELDMADWDPTMPPAEGDFRIRRGSATESTVDFDCVPVGTTGRFVSAGPWTHQHCVPGGSEACREDFMALGVGRGHAIRGCVSDPGAELTVLGWGVRE